MGQGSHRIVCPACGTNNFPTVTVCWKCGAMLQARPPAPEPARPPEPPQSRPAPAVADPVGARQGDPGVAVRAAVALGLLMPYLGLPAGLVLMMCVDADRQRIGRLCVIVSLISAVLHVLVGATVLLAMRDTFMALLTGARGAGGLAPDLQGLP